MSHIWREMADGVMGVPPVEDISEPFGEPAVLLNESRQPDVVRMPTEIGGRVLRVLGTRSFNMICPNCKVLKKDMFGYNLEDNYTVCSCPECKQYLWGRRRPE
jgi:hypothetical protein